MHCRLVETTVSSIVGKVVPNGAASCQLPKKTAPIMLSSMILKRSMAASKSSCSTGTRVHLTISLALRYDPGSCQWVKTCTTCQKSKMSRQLNSGLRVYRLSTLVTNVIGNLNHRSRSQWVAKSSESFSPFGVCWRSDSWMPGHPHSRRRWPTLQCCKLSVEAVAFKPTSWQQEKKQTHEL